MLLAAFKHALVLNRGDVCETIRCALIFSLILISSNHQAQHVVLTAAFIRPFESWCSMSGAAAVARSGHGSIARQHLNIVA